MRIGQLKGNLPSGGKQTPAIDIYHTSTRSYLFILSRITTSTVVVFVAVIVVVVVAVVDNNNNNNNICNTF